MEDKKFAIGQIAWTVTDWNGVEKIKVISEEIINVALEPYYKIHYEDSYGDSCKYKSKIFETQSEAEKYWRDQYELRKQEYRDAIKTKEKLLSVIIKSMRCDCCVDQAAIEVVEEKLRELLKEDGKEDLT